MPEEKKAGSKWTGPLWFLGLVLSTVFILWILTTFVDHKRAAIERQDFIVSLNREIEIVKRDNAACFTVDQNDFKNRGEKHDINIAPNEVKGLASFKELDALNAACVGRRHAYDFEEEVRIRKVVYANTMDSFFDWRSVGCDDEAFCAVRVENSIEERWADLIVAMNPFWLAEAQVTLEQLVTARVSGLEIAIAFYQKRLENFPRTHDYFGNSPRWVKDKIMGVAERLYGSQAEIPDSLILYVNMLEHEAYARQIDFMVQKLKAGTEYPESKELAKLIEEDLKKTSFSILQFGLRYPELRALAKQNPAEGY